MEGAESPSCKTASQPDNRYTGAVVIACWVRTKEGRQRETLQKWLTRLIDAMHGRIHDVSVAQVWAAQEPRARRRANECPWST
jgi:hypothetical protein